MLSAVVVHHRDPRQTLRCARSLLGVENGDCHPLDPQHLVVVDNSEDAKQAAQLQAGLPVGTRLLLNPRNTGFGAACVRGLQAVCGEFIMLLNPDAWAAPRCLNILVEALQANPRLGAVSPRQWWDADRQWQLPPAWLPTGIGLWALDRASRDGRSARRLSSAYRQLARSVWRTVPGGECSVVPQRALSGGAMMVRRAAAVAVGGLFDPRYFLYYEDSDLCVRLRRAGWQLAVAPQADVVHEWRHSPQKVSWMEAAQRQYLDANYRGHGQWEHRLMRSRSAAGLAAPLDPITLEAGTGILQVPSQWHGAWLLEVSPSPLLIPALGLRGHGPRATWPRDLSQRLGGGDVTLRLGPDGPCSAAQWQVFRLRSG